MENKNKHKKLFIAGAVIIASLFFTSCSDDNPAEPMGSNAKVAGRISPSSGLQKASSSFALDGVQGATVILAQAQADGSLKTVSTQSIQTDASGRFLVETNLSGTGNLIVIAAKGTSELKAIVSAKVQSGTTVYAPPLTEESTAEANIYLKLVGQGHSADFDGGELKLILNANVAAYLQQNPQAEIDFMSAFRVSGQAIIRASGNSHFGMTSSQLQAILQAKTEAEAGFDNSLYNSSDTEAEKDTCRNNYERSVLSAYSGSSAYTYAELMRIGVTAFLNSTASMNSDLKLAIAKSLYARYAFVLNYAMQQQFQAAGASEAQLNTVASAGTSLSASIKGAMDLNEISQAFVQYRSKVKAQLQITLSAFAAVIETIDTVLNGTISAKSTFNASIAGTTSVDAIINAYVTLFTAVKTAAQTSLTGASTAQVNAASQILILANMN